MGAVRDHSSGSAVDSAHSGGTTADSAHEACATLPAPMQASCDKMVTKWGEGGFSWRGLSR